MELQYCYLPLQIVISDTLHNPGVSFLYRVWTQRRESKMIALFENRNLAFSACAISLRSKLSRQSHENIVSIFSQISLHSLLEIKHWILVSQGRLVSTKHFHCFLKGQLVSYVNFIRGHRMLGCIGQEFKLVTSGSHIHFTACLTTVL